MHTGLVGCAICFTVSRHHFGFPACSQQSVLRPDRLDLASLTRSPARPAAPPASSAHPRTDPSPGAAPAPTAPAPVRSSGTCPAHSSTRTPPPSPAPQERSYSCCACSPAERATTKQVTPPTGQRKPIAQKRNTGFCQKKHPCENSGERKSAQDSVPWALSLQALRSRALCYAEPVMSFVLPKESLPSNCP